jgi:hypothetical protein
LSKKKFFHSHFIVEARAVQKWEENMKVLVLTVLLSAANIVVDADISVNVNLRNSVNEISDKFISSKIDFYKLMDVVNQHRNVTILSPSYVKLDNFSKYLRDDDNENGARDVTAIFQSLQ